MLSGGMLVVILLWLGAKLGAWQRRIHERRVGRIHNERGQAGERRAEQLLRSLGYRVCARHVTRSYLLQVDGEAEDIQLIADLIVERDGARWVAEVKTGKQAPRLGHADTRRQMLEYQLAFAVPGVLLVDAETGCVREVRFPLDREEKPRSHSSVIGRLALRWASVATLVGGAWWALHR